VVGRTWLFNRTGGSVAILMLFHLTSNVVAGAIMIPPFAGADHVRYYILFIAAAWVLALLLSRPRNRSMGLPRRPVEAARKPAVPAP
jgi:hypothetical protein